MPYKVAVAFEKRYWGGPKPTWRRAPLYFYRGAGSPIARTLRVLSRKEARKEL